MARALKTPAKPAAKKATPKAPKDWRKDNDKLVYLAGMYDSSIGLRSPGSTFAVGISAKQDWPQYMADTYGGEAKTFVAKNGKTWWGWFVDVQTKLAILDALENGGVLKGLDPSERDGIRAKLVKATGGTA